MEVNLVVDPWGVSPRPLRVKTRLRVAEALNLAVQCLLLAVTFAECCAAW